MRLFFYLWICFGNVYSYFPSIYEISDVDRSLSKRSFIHNGIEGDWMIPSISSENALSTRYIDNKPLSLYCKATGIPKPSIKWFYSNTTAIGYDNFVPLPDSNNDHLNLAEDSEANKPTISGSYFCSATNILGRVLSRKTDIQKSYLLRTVTASQEAIHFKHKAVFECVTKPDQSILDYQLVCWRVRQGKGSTPRTLTTSEDRFSLINVTRNPQLHVHQLTKEDLSDLEVQCTLEHRYVPNLPLLVGSDWTKPESEDVSLPMSYEKCSGLRIVVTQGSSVELPWCSRPNSPPVVWYRSRGSSLPLERVPVGPGSRFSMIGDGGYGNLLVRGAQVADEGLYYATADVRRRTRPLPLDLRVTVPLGLVLEMVPSPSNDRNRQGDNGTTLQCAVTGYPPPAVYWLHDGRPVKEGTVSIVTTDPRLTTTSLSLATIAPESAGVYQCVAEASEGPDRALASLPVLVTKMAPRLVSQQPPVPRKKRYATVRLDSTREVQLQCVFNSTPKATIDWLIDDARIPVSSAVVEDITRHDLYTTVATLRIDLNKVPNFNDQWMYGGMYVARATNKYGTEECRTLAFVEGVFHIRSRDNITITKGQSWTLKCYVVSSDVPEISWSKIVNGERIKFPGTHLEVESNDHREVSIQSVEKAQHDGSYECKANLGNLELTKIFNVSVAIPPMTIEIPEIGVLYQDNFYETNCKPRLPIDKPWYAWWEFTPSSATGSNVSSVITPSAKGQGAFKSLSTSWRSETNESPSFPPVPKGVPPFLVNFPNTNSKINVEFEKKLHLANLTCVVQNHAGISRKSVRIIIAVLEFNVQPPAKINFTLGDDVTLECSPKPNKLQTTTKWSFHNINSYDPNKPSSRDYVQVPLFDPEVPTRRIYRFPNGTLVVKNVTEKDPLEFLCMIESNLTTLPISKLTKIFLKVPARIMPMAPEVDIIKGLDYNLTCQVFGDDNNLHIEWQRCYDNLCSKALDASETKVKMKLTRLTHRISKDHQVAGTLGLYKCTARNAFSKAEDEKTVRLAVVSVPGPVSDHRLKAEDREISLSWSKPKEDGNKPILDYVVQWRSVEGAWQRNTSDREMKLTKLRPNTLFNVSIIARNAVGLGDSLPLVVQTLQAAPDGPVRGLECLAESSTRLILGWSPPDPLLQNGPITGYLVCHRRLSTDQFANGSLDRLDWSIDLGKKIRGARSLPKEREEPAIVCRTENGTSSDFPGLAKFTAHGFMVCPVNGLGQGPCVYAKNRTREDRPGRPPQDLGCAGTASGLELVWNPPPPDSIHGVLLHYEVYYFRPEYYGQELDGPVGMALTPSLTLAGLRPYSNYSVQVAAVNAMGRGPRSAPLVCRTPPGRPSAPGHVRAFPANGSCAVLAWAPPLRPNGPLSQYCVLVRPTGKKVCLAIADSATPYATATICGLETGIGYNFSVRAQNDQMEGEASVGGPLRLGASQVGRYIVTPARHEVVWDGAAVVLDCETVGGDGGHQIPEWSFVGRGPGAMETPIVHVEGGNLQVAGNGSLVVRAAGTGTNGSFLCRAGGSLLNHSLLVRTVVNGVPLAPHIYYSNQSTSSVFLEWRSAAAPRADDPVSKFLLRVTMTTDGSSSDHEVDGQARSKNVSGLLCGAKYLVEVRAINRAGQGPPGRLETATLGARPQWASSSSLLASSHPYALCFRLDAFLPGEGCPPSRYFVSLSPSSSAPGEPPDPVATFLPTELRSPCNNVSGLHPSTDYRYTVTASNEAGTAVTEGHARTAGPTTMDPSIKKTHEEGISYLLSGPKFYFGLVAVLIIFVLMFIVLILCYVRRRNVKHHQPCIKKKNDLGTNTFPVRTARTVPLVPSSSTNLNRKLPDLPSNTYDSGIPSLVTKPLVPKPPEDDDDMKPYATYAPTHLPESLSPSTRAKQGKKSLHLMQEGGQGPYTGGSQAHSYQYPDMASGGVPSSDLVTMGTAPGVGGQTEAYGGPAGRRGLTSGPKYNTGYSVGQAGIPPPVAVAMATGGVPQEPLASMVCQQEQYRPGGSTWSNTTGSSTKELAQVFQAPRGYPGSGLRKQEDDVHEAGCSTVRPGGQASTLTGASDNGGGGATRRDGLLGRLPPSQDFGHQDSYFESGSSGDDPGIQRFTQERCLGHQGGFILVEPRFTHRQPGPFARQSSVDSCTYESVDGPRGPPPFQGAYPGQAPPPGPLLGHGRGPHDVLPEEDESSNYQNKFVIV